MEINESVFNLEDIQDLPEKVRKGIIQHSDEFENNILTLFNCANRELSIDEVCVAYYRVFKIEKTRTQIMNKLYQISQSSRAKIEKASKKGVYKLKELKGDENAENS